MWRGCVKAVDEKSDLHYIKILGETEMDTKQKTMYYQCPQCKEWVPATRKKCGRGHDLTRLKPQFRPTKQRENPWNQTEERREMKQEPKENMPKKRCIGCGNIYNTYASECPGCGETLTPVPQETALQPVYGEEEEWDELSGSTDTMILDEEEEEEREEETSQFYFNATRYDENVFPIKSRVINIPINSEGMVLGRILFTTDNRLFFPQGSRELDVRYSHISRDNVVLTVEENQLYVSYYREDGKGKTPVYVNQEKLGADERRPLYSGDVLRFGSRKTSDKAIDVQIVADRWEERPVQDGLAMPRNDHWNRMEDFMSTMGQQMEQQMQKWQETQNSIAQMRGELQAVSKAVAEIDLSELRIRENESEESYENRLAVNVPDATPETMREYVCRFLGSVLPEGTEKYAELLKFFYENEKRRKRIFNAVFYEEVCEAARIEDYEGPMGFLGRVIEGFVMGEVADVLKAANNEAYERKKAGSRDGRVDWGGVLWLCRENSCRILQVAYGTKRTEQQMESQLKDALKTLGEIRRARNAASHSESDTKTTAESADKVITKKRYEEIKKKLLESNTIETMHGLYLRIKGGSV